MKKFNIRQRNEKQFNKKTVAELTQTLSDVLGYDIQGGQGNELWTNTWCNNGWCNTTWSNHWSNYR